MYFATPSQAVSTTSASLVCAYAGWRGRTVERGSAAVLWLAWMASPLLVVRPFAQWQGELIAIDGVLAAWFLTVAMISDRWWPMPSASVMLLVLAGHLAVAVDAPVVHSGTYFIIEEVWSYLLLAILAVGTMVEGRQRPACR